MTESDIMIDRLKNVMLCDRGASAEKILRVLKSDLYSLLSSYMSILPENISASIEAVDDGFLLSVSALSDRMLKCGEILA